MMFSPLDINNCVRCPGTSVHFLHVLLAGGIGCPA